MQKDACMSRITEKKVKKGEDHGGIDVLLIGGKSSQAGLVIDKSK